MPGLTEAWSGEVAVDVRRSSWIWNVFLKVEAADSNDGFDGSSAEVGFLPLAQAMQNKYSCLHLVL